jgi:pimeloyl-ACP methyl ester carboxylesterase
VRLFHCPAEPPRLEARSAFPILFSHGLVALARWEPTLREISRRGLVLSSLAPDMPGYGRWKAAGTTRAMNIPELADWLARLLDHEKIERVHVVGNSLGCQIGWRSHGGTDRSAVWFFKAVPPDAYGPVRT